MSEAVTIVITDLSVPRPPLIGASNIPVIITWIIGGGGGGNGSKEVGK